MKVLYIITKSNWGGAQRHVYDLSRFMKQKGYEITVALGGNGILRDKLMEAGISTRILGSLKRDISLKDDSSSLRDIWNVVREIRPDILHLHSPKAAGLGSLVGRILKVKKIIFTVHGFTMNEDRSLPQKGLIAFFTWLTMLFSTHVILLSEKEKKQAEAFPGVAEKLRVVPLGIESPTFFSRGGAIDLFQSKVPLHSKINIEKKFVIGTIGELHKNKGLVYALHAIEKVIGKFPSVVFFVIGEGDERNSLQTLIREKKLEEHVILAGYIPQAAEYLKGISLFLFPSIKEGLPYAILEAGHAGIPVISTTVGGIPEVIDDMKSGILILPKKVDEIAHAIEFLLEHRAIQKEYAQALQYRVKTYFSLDGMLRKTLDIYEEKPRKTREEKIMLPGPKTHSV